MPRTLYEPPPHRAPTPQEPVQVNTRRPPAYAERDWHQHSWPHLVYPAQGTIRLSTADTAWIVPPARAIWVPPYVDHRMSTLGVAEIRVVNIDLASAPLPLDHCQVLETSPLMRALCDTLPVLAAEDDERRTLMTRLLVAEIRDAPAVSLGLPMPRDRRLLALCQALLEDPAASQTLEDWADKVGASARTLSRLFQDELGMSFGTWRQRLRLARAATLVGEGHSLADIAQNLGYASPSAFAAMFKRTFGIPPSRFFQRGAAPA